MFRLSIALARPARHPENAAHISDLLRGARELEREASHELGEQQRALIVGEELFGTRPLPGRERQENGKRTARTRRLALGLRRSARPSTRKTSHHDPLGRSSQ